jgi:ATP-dependent Lon protease
MDDLDKKTLEYFPGKCVRKDLTDLMKKGINVPTYVLEYLLGQSCSTDDQAVIDAGVAKIRKILSENYVRPDQSEFIKSKIRENGFYTIIDKITVRLDEKVDKYIAAFTNLHIDPFVIDENIVTHNEKLLLGGVWCIVKIQYNKPEEEEEEEDLWGQQKKKGQKKSKYDSPFQIESLKPIQMPNLDLQAIIDTRKNFTKDEWVSLLLRSAGYEPAALTEKQKFHYLLRLVPFIQKNYNLVELGPRGTGKSHIYSEVSPYSILMSGGSTSSANLFYNMSRRTVGLVGHWDTVAFDEVGKSDFTDDTIQILKNYMANGSFARGADSINADASFAFEGNTKRTVQQMLRSYTLFDPFPETMNSDSALFDRVHYYLPGWETPKLRSSLFTTHFGLISDCLSEFCHEMRKYDFTGIFDKYYSLNKNVNKRDEDGIRRTMSGLAKLIYPDQEISKEEAKELLDYAIEGRRRVKEQLKKMVPSEFADVNLGYVDNENGQETIVEVPEKPNSTLIPEISPDVGHVYAIGEGEEGFVSVYCLQNSKVTGTGKLGNLEGLGSSSAKIKTSIKSAFDFFAAHCNEILLGHQSDYDYNLFMDDLQDRGASDDVSVAELIGLCSIFGDKPVLPSIAVVGRIVASESLMPVSAELTEIVTTAIGAGAKTLLIPDKCKEQFDKLPDALKNGSAKPVFYSNPLDAVKKALGLEQK